MQNLIQVNQQLIGNAEVNAVSARELWQTLQKN